MLSLGFAANTELHEKLIEAMDKIAKDAAAAAAADPGNEGLQRAAELAARDAAAAHGDRDAINEIAEDADAAAHPEFAAIKERIAEAGARDAAAEAGNPVARQAVEDDKTLATIFDPKDQEKWMNDHPPWHTPEWHAKHDGAVPDAGDGPDAGAVTDAGTSAPYWLLRPIEVDSSDAAYIDHNNTAMDKYLTKYEADIDHNIDDRNDVIDKFINEHESNNGHDLNINSGNIDPAADIGHDTYIDPAADIGHDTYIDPAADIGHDTHCDPVADIGHDVDHGFISDLLHSWVDSAHGLFV